jgi:hypothetical protein
MARIRRQPRGDQIKSSAFALLDLFDELRNDFEDVADDAEVGVLKDRRFGILIDRDDELGGFHS